MYLNQRYLVRKFLGCPNVAVDDTRRWHGEASRYRVVAEVSGQGKMPVKQIFEKALHKKSVQWTSQSLFRMQSDGILIVLANSERL